MPLDIFAPRERTNNNTRTSDVVGRFRSGHQINKRPISLKEWRVTTGDPDVAEAIRESLGGDDVSTWETKREDNLEVFTTATEVDVILEGIEVETVAWLPQGKTKGFMCKGVPYESEERKPFVCTERDYANKQEHEDAGHVCVPKVKVRFRLADNPDLGVFDFESGAWSLLSQVGYILGDMNRYETDAVLATLGLEFVDLGPDKKFTKPVITVTGAYEEE